MRAAIVISLISIMVSSQHATILKSGIAHVRIIIGRSLEGVSMAEIYSFLRRRELTKKIPGKLRTQFPKDFPNISFNFFLTSSVIVLPQILRNCRVVGKNNCTNFIFVVNNNIEAWSAIYVDGRNSNRTTRMRIYLYTSIFDHWTWIWGWFHISLKLDSQICGRTEENSER